MYVCVCHGVTDRQIRKAVSNGADSIDKLGEVLGVATGCGRCRDCARTLLDNERLAEWRDAISSARPGPLQPTGAPA